MYKFLILLLFVGFAVHAQDKDSIPTSTVNRDSLRYTNLKNRMYKYKVSKSLYKLLFRDVYNKGKVTEVKTIETNPFTEFEGMTINKIIIKQLDLIGQSVYDTARVGNRSQQFISQRLHTNTREGIIRKSFLLFKEGDKISSKVLKDNERLLRTNRQIVDARFVVIPRKDSTWMADVMVIIQDAWSLNFGVGYSNLNKFRLKVENTNVAGTTHSQLTGIQWDNQDTLPKFHFRTIYTVPYIGKTFITGQASFVYERDLNQQSFHFYRNFLTTETKYAGSIDAGHIASRVYKRSLKDPEFGRSFWVSYYYYDFWIGRAFKFPFENKLFTKNSRFVVAYRHNNYNYRDRPEVTANLNKNYWDKRANLISLGYSNRNYKRDVLIYSFGRTEDVPVGNSFSVTFGQEDTEFGIRGYSGFQFAKGKYLPWNIGYMYALLNYGSYFKSREAQQGVIHAQLNYFSNLIPIKKGFFRQFVNINYTNGFSRDTLDYLNISGSRGIRGLNSDQLIGTKNFTVGLESVFFSDKSILGFRIAYFATIDMGLVNTHPRSVFHGPLYAGYGLGLRLRNESLVISTLQLRFSYFPNIPGNSAPFRFAIEGNTPLRLRDFDISQPTIVPLQ